MAAILRDVPRVEDRETWLGGLARLLTWIAAAVLAVLAAIYIGPLIRVGVAWVAALIPSPADGEVKLRMEGKPEQADAIRRATDPTFNCRWERRKRKQQESTS